MKLRGLLLLVPLLLAACAGHAPKPDAPVAGRPPASETAADPDKVSPYPPAQEDPSKRGDYVAGGLFRPGQADSVPDHIPDVDAIPEPVVRDEPRARTGNRDYKVLGKRYHVLDSGAGYVAEGKASYYGKKFHGRRTSSGEVYDMYAFTAAHKTLPLPSYARVTNLDNGKSVVVRINDRGPFHKGRIIDLSYAAAVKLGYRDKGTARVRVEVLQPAAKAASTAAAPSPDGAMTPADGAVADVSGKPAAQPSAMDQLLQQLPDSAPPVAASDKSAGPATPGHADAPLTLQVASFDNPDNAHKALATLQAAAIAGAQLRDADVGGRKVWRLQVSVIGEAMLQELAARIEGLGFGRPHQVRN